MVPEARIAIHQCECESCKARAHPQMARRHYQTVVFPSRLNETQRRWYVGLLSQKPASPSDRQLSLITGLDGKMARRDRRELETDLSDRPTDG
jgi:hypothetical protein